jgi:hypothetical protein
MQEKKSYHWEEPRIRCLTESDSWIPGEFYLTQEERVCVILPETIDEVDSIPVA